MFKKFVSITIIFSFILSITSCIAYQKTNIEKAMRVKNKSVRSPKILMLKTKSGKMFYFSKDYPGRWEKDGIEVKSIVFHKIEIDKADVVEKKVDENSHPFLVTRDGKNIEYDTLNVENDKIVLTTYKRGIKVIPYSDIDFVKIKRFDTGRTVVLTTGIIILIVSVIIALVEWPEVKKSLETPERECAIKTAAIGSSLDSKLNMIRNFRDNFLMKYNFGRTLVAIYYECSPHLTMLIKRDVGLKNVIRISLLPLIMYCSLMNASLDSVRKS